MKNWERTKWSCSHRGWGSFIHRPIPNPALSRARMLPPVTRRHEQMGEHVSQILHRDRPRGPPILKTPFPKGARFVHRADANGFWSTRAMGRGCHGAWVINTPAE